jgi:hypothetical protein
MKAVSAARRLSALVAFLAVLALLVITVLVLIRQWPVLIAALVLLGVAITAAGYALTRRRMRRAVATAVAVLALVALIVLFVINGHLLTLRSWSR